MDSRTDLEHEADADRGSVRVEAARGRVGTEEGDDVGMDVDAAQQHDLALDRGDIDWRHEEARIDPFERDVPLHEVVEAVRGLEHLGVEVSTIV